MGKTATPFVAITDSQIEKAVELYRVMLRKHRGELGSEPIQQVLGQPEFVGEMVGVLRRRVKAVSNLIVRRVKVDRTRTPQQVLHATGRKQLTHKIVVEAMPHGEGEETDVYFFLVGRPCSNEEIEVKCAFYGLRLADPYSLAQVNEDDPSFADTHPNDTHWKDAKGEWCDIVFDRWSDGRYVTLYHRIEDWFDYRWVACLRK
ncbi:MAG: hypothetical protein HYV77_00565 [Candidatus Wildermuthbacteria bacterium]|nr:hypothetical protein [Candidatus Wildermuthbacteria bacterium]